MKPALLIATLYFLVLSGCVSSVRMYYDFRPSYAYADKVPGKHGIYLPSESVGFRMLWNDHGQTPPVALHIEIGLSSANVITDAIKAPLESTMVFSRMPSAVEMSNQGLRGVFVPEFSAL